MRWDAMHIFTSILICNKRKWGLQPCCIIQRVLLYQYLLHQYQTTISSYAYQRSVQKIQHCNAWTSNISNFSIKRNTTIDDKVYSKISKINFIYQVIWLMWILKLNRGNSNNEWKFVDHGPTFTCLLQLSSQKDKCHLMITSKTWH
jgi:hypothetical protein